MTEVFTDHCAAKETGPCELAPLGVFRDQSGLVGEVRVERCRNCGAGVSRPPLPDIAFLYADRSSQDFQGQTSGLSRTIKHIAFTGAARTMLAQVGATPGRVIDFACGSGLFTRCMGEVLGDRSEVIGADFHDQPPPELAGMRYCPMAELGELAGTADMAIAMHVVEHDDDPSKIVDQIAALLKPGGAAVIEVPNIDCVWAPIFGQFWDAWYLPYHRVHFTRASFTALVNRRGLRVEKEIAVSVPTMGRSIANLLGVPNSTLFIPLSAGLQPLQWLLEKLTGRPSALRVVARKL